MASEQLTAIVPLQGGRLAEFDREGKCLLSLDGGGVRGFSSLLILKYIMDQVNAGKSKEYRLSPCDIFDLIGGTSTGG
jgi:patatin-like phospholipase/acyl hydrolase